MGAAHDYHEEMLGQEGAVELLGKFTTELPTAVNEGGHGSEKAGDGEDDSSKHS